MFGEISPYDVNYKEMTHNFLYECKIYAFIEISYRVKINDHKLIN